jgi:hypothetical protein
MTAIRSRQQGTAERRLSIGKDGWILQSELVEAAGAPKLRD